MKKLILLITFILLFTSSVISEICFQDNTHRNSLRVCNISGSCVILHNSNCTDMKNIAYCSNIGADRLEYQVYDDAMTHPQLWLLGIIVVAIIATIVIWLFKKKK